MKRLILGTNLKMYKGVNATLDYLRRLKHITSDIDQKDLCLFVIPSYLALFPACQENADKLILLGAQNMHWEDNGQFTGEISPLMLKEIGIDIAEIGHSERRQLFNETDSAVNKKALAALKHGMKPLICVGETMEDKTLGITYEKLRLQVKTALNGITTEQASNVWLAYEPVWAIGVNGTPAEPNYACASHNMIRDVLVELYPATCADIPILYGGSVNMDNARGLIVQKNVDGLFIGRAAWTADSFNALIRDVFPYWRTKPI